jgi:ParB-like chromosome segregation protein Spo0J
MSQSTKKDPKAELVKRFGNLRPHPLAERIPRHSETDYRRLRDDIEANGQHVPIVLYEGMVLDGIGRLRACLELAIEPMFREFEANDGSPVLFVVSMNYARRHLSDDQKAEVRAEFAEDMRAAGLTQEEIAKLLGVSTPTVNRDLHKTRQTPRRTPPEADDGPHFSHENSETAGQEGSARTRTITRPPARAEPETITNKRGQHRPTAYKPRTHPSQPSKVEGSEKTWLRDTSNIVKAVQDGLRSLGRKFGERSAEELLEEEGRKEVEAFRRLLRGLADDMPDRQESICDCLEELDGALEGPRR